MRLGISLPHVGRAASPDSITTAARWAEANAFDSVWVRDRVLCAEEPRTPHLTSGDGFLPTEMREVHDPLLSMALAATATERVRIGSSVLVAPWYPPVLLARSLTTLDHISNGRLAVGLGIGWSVDEYEAVGVPMRHLGSRLDETLDVLDAVWAEGVVSHCGPRIRVVPSTIEPKPVQTNPPIYLAAYTPAGLDRVARRADGWNPAGLPVEALGPMWHAVRDLAHGHGREPDDLELIVRANALLTDGPLGPDRPSYHGTIDQVAADLAATRAVGADEIVLGIMGQDLAEPDAALDEYAALAAAADLLPTAA